MKPMQKSLGDDTSGLNRRELMGSAAAVGMATAGGFTPVAAQAATATPVVSVHLDVPFVSLHGAAPYSPPARSAAEAGLVEPHELA
jgi:hypothetical protein